MDAEAAGLQSQETEGAGASHLACSALDEFDAYLQDTFERAVDPQPTMNEMQNQAWALIQHHYANKT
jgi:hypothetical protein